MRNVRGKVAKQPAKRLAVATRGTRIVRKYFRIPNGDMGRGTPLGLVMAKVDKNHMRLGISLCAPADRFDRAKAIEIAQEKFDSGEMIVPLRGCFGAVSDLPHVYHVMLDDIRFAMREAIQADWWANRNK